MKLRDRMAYVTGAASGNGAAAARALAAQGAAVAVADVQTDAAEAVAADIRAVGGRALAISHDVADEGSWREGIERAVEALGPLRILVNNAGVGGSGLDFEDETLDAWRRVQAVNLDGVFLGCREAVRRMKEGPPASIVNISSVFGIVGYAGTHAYCASKGGVRLLTKSLALYCQRQAYPIRVNSIHPGLVKTAMTDGPADGSRAQAFEGFRRQMIANTPMARIGVPEEIASAVVFLASDDASFMTGSELVVDGGLIAH
ncbi:MAG: glucose 1-dehydrogenase [Burkholderiaceae bacterium]